VSGTAARATAVVVGLDCITGLQSARLLAARGVPVVGIASQPRHFCARTRVVQRVVAAPTSGPGLIDALERLASDETSDGPLFLLPCTDPSVLAISAARDRLPGRFRFVLPDDDLLRRLVDKVTFAELATSLGLPIPTTRILRDRGDVAPAIDVLRFPAVVKPAVKTPAWLAAAGAKAIRVESPSELVAVTDRAFAWSDSLIVQSWIEGGEDRLISCNAYFDANGAPLATFMARKIRQWPPDTGTSCLGEEVRDEEALDLAVRLFQAVGYRGLAYLEVKRDAVTGELGIIEPNLGRPTGRSSIAERGGVELILTAYADALGLPLPARRTQTYRGVKWIYWRHDLQAAMVRFRRGELTVGGWLRSVRGPSIEAVGSLRDPLPFVLDVAGTLRAALRAAALGAVRRVRRRPIALAEP
jgi:predicted ATP-grasp superfamily ATP-dependent carboligase